MGQLKLCLQNQIQLGPVNGCYCFDMPITFFEHFPFSFSPKPNYTQAHIIIKRRVYNTKQLPLRQMKAAE